MGTFWRDRRLGARGHAVWGGAAGAVVWGAGACVFEVLVTVWAHFCKIEGRVLGGIVTQVLGGMQFGVLMQVLFLGVLVQVLSDAGHGWRMLALRE